MVRFHRLIYSKGKGLAGSKRILCHWETFTGCAMDTCIGDSRGRKLVASLITLAGKKSRSHLPFRSDADLLKEVLGPASKSYPEEYAAILKELKEPEVEIVWRTDNTIASEAVKGTL